MRPTQLNRLKHFLLADMTMFQGLKSSLFLGEPRLNSCQIERRWGTLELAKSWSGDAPDQPSCV
jgi:hypothetical protein